MGGYPNDEDIKVKWTWLHISMVVAPTCLIWAVYWWWPGYEASHPLNKGVSLLGLNVDIIGVVIASLRTPYYGSFCDGGAIEVKRAEVERRFFQGGMLLIAVGFLLQAIGSLL